MRKLLLVAIVLLFCTTGCELFYAVVCEDCPHKLSPVDPPIPDPIPDPVEPDPIPDPVEPDPIDPTKAYYINPVATGTNNGADWTNAYKELPRLLKRGYTYYIADGEYPVPSIRTIDDGNDLIILKKATITQHGTSVGWKDIYGDNRAIFDNFSISASHVVIDGVQEYGFEIYGRGAATSNYALMKIEAEVDDLTFRHIDLHRISKDYKGSGFSLTRGGNDDITVTDCYIHDLFGVHFYFIGSKNVLIDHTIMARNKCTAEWHSESVQARGVTNMVVSNCHFEDIEGTATIISGSMESSNWEVFGNVFYNTPGFGSGSGHGTVADNMNGSIHHVRVFNNTFVNVNSKCGVRFWKSVGNTEAFNNLYYNCRGVGYLGTYHHHNSYYDCQINDIEYSRTSGDRVGDAITSGDPLQPGLSFRPKFPIPGVRLEGTHKDPSGAIRGVDGGWDRGAYEVE